jgi:predicted RNA-binding Zn-ribbon protein involved in translation (DUF1610 family)
MNCTKCNEELKKGSKFCHGCGATIETEQSAAFNCPQCGKELAAGSKFCNSCGAKIESKPAFDFDDKSPYGMKLAKDIKNGLYRVV